MVGNKKTLVVFAVLALALSAFAADGSSLKPPPGAKVAVVVFEDLQCPDCARAYPVVLHDFPLPRHNWSFRAAVLARYFDTKSQKLGDDYRGYIYKNQQQIVDEATLQNFTQKFADDVKVPLPFAIDPDGKLTDKVKEDRLLGQKIGLEHTPTIFVVANGATASPFVEVVDRDQLSQIIEDMQKKAGPAAPAKSAPTKKSAAKSKKTS